MVKTNCVAEPATNETVTVCVMATESVVSVALNVTLCAVLSETAKVATPLAFVVPLNVVIAAFPEAALSEIVDPEIGTDEESLSVTVTVAFVDPFATIEVGAATTVELAALTLALVAVMLYVFVVTPSCAVTTTVIMLLPTLRGIELDAEPELTATPFTVIVAPAYVAVGVTVIDELTKYSLVVYEYVLEENVGESDPLLRHSPDKLATFEFIVTVVLGEVARAYVVSAALVTVTRQVPTVVAVNVVDETLQPVAVPFVAVKVTAPLPDPPE